MIPFITFLFITAGLVVSNWQSMHVLYADWDEGMYAQIAYEMLKHKTLVSTFNGHLWFDKPPLGPALFGLTYALFGRSEFWSRMTMVIFGIVMGVLTYFLAKKILTSLFPEQIKKQSIFLNQIVFLLPVFILFCFPIVLDRSTILNTDIIVGVGWVGYFLFKDNFYVKSLFLLIGVWGKSVLGFYPVVFDVLTIRKKDITLRNILRFISITIISCSWYIFGYLKFGNYFIQDHFFSQVLKRLNVPIELHFGGKFYYLQYLWQSLNILNIFLIAAYCFIIFDLYKIFKKDKTRIVQHKNWWHYLVLLSAIPFFIFLNLSKTKIYWYVAIFAPSLSLPFGYIYFKLNKILRYVLIVLIIGYFLITFVPRTFFTNGSYSPPERLQLAECLQKQQSATIGVLVDEQERKNRNFLEAAHYQTESSFIYGGSPSFVFYVQKPVSYFYDPQEFINKLNQFSLISLTKADANKLGSTTFAAYKKVCTTDNWIGLSK